MVLSPSPAFVAALPVLLLLVQLVLNVPQLVKLVRAEHGGVPLTGEALSLVAGAGWVVWAALEQDLAIGLSGLLAVAGFGPSTWLLLRAGRPWRVAAALAGTIGVLGVVAFLLGGGTLLGSALTSFAALQYGAYVLEAFRCDDWSGYSPTSGLLRITYGLGWALYGFWQANVPVLVWGVLTTVTFAITATRAAVWRLERQRVLVPPSTGMTAPVR